NNNRALPTKKASKSTAAPPGPAHPLQVVPSRGSPDLCATSHAPPVPHRPATSCGTVHRGYLGVHIQSLSNPDLAARLGAPEEGGVLVTDVEKDAPAAKAGLKEGDVITAVNGQKVHDGLELKKVVASVAPGKEVELSVVRDGKAETLKAKVEEQPKNF